MGLNKQTDTKQPSTGKENTCKTAEKLSEGSASGQGAAEGAHYGKARRQTQKEVPYK